VQTYLARVGQDHDFNRWVGLELLNHPHDLLHHGRRQAVAGLLILERRGGIGRRGDTRGQQQVDGVIVLPSRGVWQVLVRG
jgi:hypothetical protein